MADPSPIGRHFLALVGRDLTGRDRRLPDDLDGPTFLFVAHRQHQQRQVDEWIALVASTGLPALEAPVMKRRWRPASGLIEGGMASNMTEDVRRRTICVYTEVDAWRADRGFAPGEAVTAVLLDAEGVVRFCAYGRPDGDTAAAVAAAVASLESGQAG